MKQTVDVSNKSFGLLREFNDGFEQLSSRKNFSTSTLFGSSSHVVFTQLISKSTSNRKNRYKCLNKVSLSKNQM